MTLTPAQTDPECPGPDCLPCNGGACRLCGAGCWNHAPEQICEHDVEERHRYPEPQSVRCEAWDIVPTEDDAEYVRCPNVGVRVLETDGFGHRRTRIACAYHRSPTEERPS